MNTTEFLNRLERLKSDKIKSLAEASQSALGQEAAIGDVKKLLQIALINEVSVSELAAHWMPSTREIDVKIAFARQAGDEASHFQLVTDRLKLLGFDLSGFQVPAANPLFEFLRTLTLTTDRIAAGLFALESIAYAVNENFIAFCDHLGDHETIRIYRDCIQPDERAHQELGRKLLERYALTDEAQARVEEVVARVFSIAGATRTKAAETLGTACFPGC